MGKHQCTKNIFTRTPRFDIRSGSDCFEIQDDNQPNHFPNFLFYTLFLEPQSPQSTLDQIYLQKIFLSRIAPIFITLVLSLLTSRPDIFLNQSKTRMTPLRLSSSAFSITVVSSAYCDSLFSTPYVSIPLITGYSRITWERISAHKTKRYGDKGSPCRQPLESYISSEKLPFCSTLEKLFSLSREIHLVISGPKLNSFKHSLIKFHSIVSNAFA